MRYAIISDIHGNLEALQAVLTHLEYQAVEVIICLGDIVGYYSDPDLCVKTIQKRAQFIIAGNHDLAAVNRIDTSNFTQNASIAMEWTKNQLTEESKAFLRSLPICVELEGLVFAHASPALPEKFHYVIPTNEAIVHEAFNAMVQNINFLGHTHWPFVVSQEHDTITRLPADTLDLKKENRYLINVGSVGQPRNRDPRCCYVLFDSGTNHLQFAFIQYDISITQKKVLDNNLPSFLAERLAKGK